MLSSPLNDLVNTLERQDLRKHWIGGDILIVFVENNKKIHQPWYY